MADANHEGGYRGEESAQACFLAFVSAASAEHEPLDSILPRNRVVLDVNRTTEMQQHKTRKVRIPAMLVSTAIACCTQGLTQS